MNTFKIPIFKKAYDLYKTMFLFRNTIPKQDRYTLWQRCENLSLDIIDNILLAGQLPKDEKLPTLNKISLNLNSLRVFLRMSKDVKTIDNKKYASLSGTVDDIGKMLGGWIRSNKTKSSANQNTLLK